ncbi:MAG: hypothetical protein ACLP01_06645 [Solirubrobacteraceae bacterium]
MFLSTLYLQDLLGYGALHAGLLMMPMAAMGGVFAIVSGRLVASRGPRRPLIMSGALTAAGAILLIGLSAHTAVWLPGRRLPRLRRRFGPGQPSDH